MRRPKTRAAWFGFLLGIFVAVVAGILVFVSGARAVLFTLVALVMTMTMYLPKTPLESDPLISHITLGVFAVLWSVFIVLPVALVGAALGALVKR